MASLADYAPTQANEQAHGRRGPSPWITALLTILTPGLGHIYIGQARRGITLFALVLVADTLLMFAMMGVLARFWMFAVSLALLSGLWLFIMIDAVVRALRTHEAPDPGYNKLVMVAGAFAMAHPEMINRLILAAFTYTGEGSPTLADRAKQLEFYKTHNRRPRDRNMIRSVFTRDKPGTSDPAGRSRRGSMAGKATGGSFDWSIP